MSNPLIQFFDFLSKNSQLGPSLLWGKPFFRDVDRVPWERTKEANKKYSSPPKKGRGVLHAVPPIFGRITLHSVSHDAGITDGLLHHSSASVFPQKIGQPLPTSRGPLWSPIFQCTQPQSKLCYRFGLTIFLQSKSPRSKAWINASAVAMLVATGILCTSHRRSRLA